jgi:hypothetical protein
MQTHKPKVKVLPQLKAVVGLMTIEPVEFAMRYSVGAPTWCVSNQCFRLATYQGRYPR